MKRERTPTLYKVYQNQLNRLKRVKNNYCKTSNHSPHFLKLSKCNGVSHLIFQPHWNFWIVGTLNLSEFLNLHVDTDTQEILGARPHTC